MKVLLLDNFDSFTFMLRDYMEQCGAEVHIERNNCDKIIDLLKSKKFEAFVISPGPKTPKESGILMQCLDWAIKLNMPVFGICLGHQAIGEYFGSTLIHARLPRHGKVDEITHLNHEMFKNIPEQFNATRYHSLVLSNLGSTLTPTAFCNDEIMALAHNKLPVWGVQYHPESCLTQGGLTLLQNFFTMVKSL